MVHEVNEAPLFYIVNRGLSPEQVDGVLVYLSITPCQAVFVSDPLDAGLARNFSAQVIHTDSESTALLMAKRWATDIGRPMLVVGAADFLDAVFADGRREPAAIHA